MSTSVRLQAMPVSELTSHKPFSSFTLFCTAPLESCDADQDTARKD
jgi:hypothetical protein